MYAEFFSTKLKELRIKSGLSQREVGKGIGVSQEDISRYENGKREPDIETVGKLLAFFEISADYLYGTGANKKDPHF